MIMRERIENENGMILVILVITVVPHGMSISNDQYARKTDETIDIS